MRCDTVQEVAEIWKKPDQDADLIARRELAEPLRYPQEVHAEYGSLFKAQRVRVKDGEFASRVAAAIARMPHAHVVHIKDNDADKPDTFPFPFLSLRNNRILLAILTLSRCRDRL